MCVMIRLDTYSQIFVIHISFLSYTVLYNSIKIIVEKRKENSPCILTSIQSKLIYCYLTYP